MEIARDKFTTYQSKREPALAVMVTECNLLEVHEFINKTTRCESAQLGYLSHYHADNHIPNAIILDNREDEHEYTAYIGDVIVYEYGRFVKYEAEDFAKRFELEIN